jgi:hypothetical protein
VAAGITALATIALVPPWRAAAIRWWSVLDTSWMLGLHVAFAAGWRWGHDVVFTYGPLGFLATRLYDPRTRLVMLALWVALAVLLWAAVWTLVRRRAGRPWSAIVWVLVTVCLLRMEPESLWLVLAALLLADRIVAEPFPPALRAGLVVALAAGALVKGTDAIAAGLALAGLLADPTLPCRTRLGLALLAVAALLGAWLLAGQRLADLPAFAIGMREIVTGYGDALGIAGPPRQLLAAIATSALVALGWIGPGSRRLALAPRLAFLALLWLTLLASFVRHDGFHVLLAVAVLGSLGVLAPALGRGRASALAAIIAAGLFVLGWLSPASLALGPPTASPAETAAALDTFGRAFPCPALDGPVDVYPYAAASLLVHGLDWRPRPVWQSYAAFTPRLAAMNASALEASTAPSHLLVDVAPFDGRLPALDDGPSWPLFWRYYAVEGVGPAFVELSRRETPRPLQRSGLAEELGTLDVALPIPELDGGPLMARLTLSPTWLGRLAGALWRRPAVWITVVTADGERTRYRLVPGMAAAGFIISPLVRRRDDFAAIMLRDWTTAGWGGADAVTSVTVAAPTWAWRSAYRIALTRWTEDGAGTARPGASPGS